MFGPGVSRLSQALPIALASGAHRDLDFRVASVPAFALSGQILGLADAAGHAAFLKLFKADDDATYMAEVSVAEAWSTSSGVFSFPKIPSGAYMVDARVNDLYWSRHEVIVGNQDVENLAVQLQPTLSLSGRTIWEGASRSPEGSTLLRPMAVMSDTGPLSPQELADIQLRRSPPLVELLDLALTRADLHSTGGRIQLSPDGTFVMEGLHPGRFIVSDGHLNGWFLKSARINGREATEAPVDITSDSTGAVLTFSRVVGTVRGLVQTSTGAPDIYSMVVLFAPDPRLWPGMYAVNWRHVMKDGCDTAGRFSFQDVQPGDYYLHAIGPEESARLDEDMLKMLAASAVRVHVTGDQTVIQTLRR